MSLLQYRLLHIFDLLTTLAIICYNLNVSRTFSLHLTLLTDSVSHNFVVVVVPSFVYFTKISRSLLCTPTPMGSICSTQKTHFLRVYELSLTVELDLLFLSYSWIVCVAVSQGRSTWCLIQSFWHWQAFFSLVQLSCN